jgi:hypothetical protein
MLTRMIRHSDRSRLVALVLGIFSGLTILVAQSTNSPEAAIRELVRAMYAKDVAAYERVTTDHPLRSRLTSGTGPTNEAGLRRLREDPGSLQIREMRPALFHGKEVDNVATAPVGTSALYMAAHQGSPMVLPLVKRADGWKVDIRWWVATSQMMEGRVKPTPPEIAVRSLLAAVLRFDRARASRFLTDPKQVDLLFLGGPREREPSGVLDEAAGEMALVEIGPGEFYPLPIDRVVEGGSTGDRKVFVGLFGPIEIPFVLRAIGTEWKVEAAPYLALMNQ